MNERDIEREISRSYLVGFDCCMAIRRMYGPDAYERMKEVRAALLREHTEKFGLTKGE